MLCIYDIGDFEVKALLNDQSHKVQYEIEVFFADRTREDLLRLYLSGHGIEDEEGLLHFAAVNTHHKYLGAMSIPSDFVSRMMFRSRSRKQILLLDCCYGGAFSRGMGMKAGQDIHTGEHFRQGLVRVVITASDAMQYSFEADDLKVEGQQRRSIFAAAVIEGLTTGKADLNDDGRISYGELYDYARRRVMY